MLRSLTPKEERALILSVGTHAAQRPLSPVEVAELLDRTLAAGTPAAELAHELQFRGTSMLGRFRRLLSLPVEFRHTVDWGAGPARLSFTQAHEVARLATEDDRGRLAQRVLEVGLSSQEVKQAVQLVQRGNTGVDDAVDAALRMRPTVERRFVLIGSIDEALRARLARHTQAQRDALLRALLERLAVEASGRLGAERFTLSSREEAQSSMPPPDELERLINEHLASSLPQEEGTP